MSEIKNHPEIVNLLVSLSFCASALAIATNGTRELNPSPKNIERDNENFIGSDVEIAQKVSKVIDTIPPVSKMKVLKDETELKKLLDKGHPLAYPLFRWILSTNKAHFAKVLDKDRIPNLTGITQYIMVSGNPEQEMIFRSKKKIFGSFYAFHGSNSGNWHCILRCGLKNYSNTEKMSAGAAAGPGIYMAKLMSTSLGYTGTSSNIQNWKNTDSKGVLCMAICEVINDTSGYKIFDWGYTVQDETLVATRYLLVWENGNKNYNYNSSISADSLKLPQRLYQD